jgi:ATP-dependent Zn protease
VIFEGQLNGHQVSKVTMFTKAHSFRATLVDGRVVRVVFPSAEQQRLIDDARAKSITVKVARGQPPSHKRRYIVGGIVIVLVVAGLLVYMRRRRMREEE